MDNDLTTLLQEMLIAMLPLIFGWTLDLRFGDPQQLPHPVVYMGKWISFWEHRLNHGRHRMLKGAVMSVISILAVFIITRLILQALQQASELTLILAVILQTVIIFFCLAGKTLRHEVAEVFRAVDHSVEAGRTQVGRIVGRDTSELTPQEIRTAALETLAENLSDGVIAPLFWYAVLGVPGMLTYKMINTLDSMIGYHSERYKDFGCWAAHIDDIANYIPARITALLIAMTATLLYRTKSLRAHLQFIIQFGPQHASPNSGWPESALASLLDCRFGGPHNYFGQYFYKPFIGTNPRQLITDDMHQSIRTCFWAEVWFVIIIIIASVISTIYL